MKTLQHIREASGDKEAYQKFFNGLLKKFGVKSPSELEGDKKKEFYNAIDSGWEGDNELKEIFSRAQMKKAIDIARKSTGNYDKAYAEIEKIKKGLGREHIIANALKKANESVELDEAANVKSVMSELNKRLKLLKDTIKYGNDNDTITRLENIEIFLGKSVKDLKKDLKEEVELEEGRDFVVVHAKKGKMEVKNASSAYDAAQKAAKKWGLKSTAGVDAHLKESVELEEVKKGQTFSKKEAEAHFKKEYGSKFNAKKMGTETDDKGVKYWMDKGHSGEAVPMKESVELEEAKKITVDVDYTCDDSRECAKIAKKHKVKIKSTGRTTADITGDKKNVLAWMLASGWDKEDITDIYPELTEAVDCRTKGYKEAVKRSLLRKETREAKKAELEAQKQKEMEEEIANSTGVNIAGVDKPLGKVNKRKSFKESLELTEAKDDCTIQNDGRMNIAVCIDGLSFADARKGTRAALMNINDFKKSAKKTYADAKGKKTIPAVKKEIKSVGARNFYAKWPADSSSSKDDSVEIWYTK